MKKAIRSKPKDAAAPKIKEEVAIGASWKQAEEPPPGAARGIIDTPGKDQPIPVGEGELLPAVRARVEDADPFEDADEEGRPGRRH